MSNDNDLLKQRKESLLSELESIKYILGEADTTDIPVLDDVIIEETDPSIENYHQAPHQTTHTSAVSTVEAFSTPSENPLPTGVLPGQQSLFKEPLKSTDTRTPKTPIHNTITPSPSFKTTPHSAGSHSSLAQNPFLPPHVRKRFQDSSFNTTSTPNMQMTENHEATITPPSSPGSTVETKGTEKTSYTEQLVDQLIAHHLPKIEAELRQKLLEVVNTHNERMKK